MKGRDLVREQVGGPGDASKSGWVTTAWVLQCTTCITLLGKEECITVDGGTLCL